jgi:hypothetical protein
MEANVVEYMELAKPLVDFLKVNHASLVSLVEQLEPSSTAMKQCSLTLYMTPVDGSSKLITGGEWLSGGA